MWRYLQFLLDQNEKTNTYIYVYITVPECLKLPSALVSFSLWLSIICLSLVCLFYSPKIYMSTCTRKVSFIIANIASIRQVKKYTIVVSVCNVSVSTFKEHNRTMYLLKSNSIASTLTLSLVQYLQLKPNK